MAACEGVIGANFDRDGKTPPQSSDPTLPQNPAMPGSPDGASSGGPGDPAAQREAGTPTASPVPIVCGDMNGLDPRSPWPMAGYCPTRANVSPAPALVKPRIAWRYTLDEPGATMLTQPSIAGDGTVYVMAMAHPMGNAWQTYLLGVKDGVETLRVPIPAIDNAYHASGTPAIARDGALVVNAQGKLWRISPTGTIVWSVPLGAGNSMGTSPLILGNGIIVAAAVEGVRGVNGSDGTTAWTYAGARFEGGVAMTTTGLLAVTQSPAPSTLEGYLHMFDDRGAPRWSQKLPGRSSQSPVTDATNRTLVFSGAQHFMYEATGTVSFITKMTKPGNIVEDEAHDSYSVVLPSIIWTRGHFDAVSLDPMSGAATTHEEEGAEGGPVAAGDGSLVVGVRDILNTDRIEGRNSDGTKRWRINIERTVDSPMPAALGSDGTAYVPATNILYAIGDAK